ADVMMPGKSGYEVCEALKSDPATSAIPVMLLAGTFEPFDENRARAARADGHIVKPFESQALLDKVKVLVGMPTGARTVAPTYTTAASAAAAGAKPMAQATVPSAPRPMPRTVSGGPVPMAPRPMGVHPSGT